MKDIKQGTENTELVKDADSKKKDYIFQKNTKTKLGASIIIGILILIVVSVLISLYYFQTPS